MQLEDACSICSSYITLYNFLHDLLTYLHTSSSFQLNNTSVSTKAVYSYPLYCYTLLADDFNSGSPQASKGRKITCSM